MMSGISGISPMNTSLIDRNYIPLSGKREPVQQDFAPLLDKALKDEAADKQLMEQCRALETFLVKNMLSQMRKNVMKADLIDTGFAGEVYEDMLWDEYAKEYAKKADFGLAELAYLELTGQRGTKLLH
jgi:Rod binding domain-containing protein